MNGDKAKSEQQQDMFGNLPGPGSEYHAPKPKFDGDTYDEAKDYARLTGQIERIRALMVEFS